MTLPSKNLFQNIKTLLQNARGQVVRVVIRGDEIELAVAVELRRRGGLRSIHGRIVEGAVRVDGENAGADGLVKMS